MGDNAEISDVCLIRHQKRGVETCPILWGGRKRRLLSLLVPIAISLLDWLFPPILFTSRVAGSGPGPVSPECDLWHFSQTAPAVTRTTGAGQKGGNPSPSGDLSI